MIVIITRSPLRISLGGGGTDLPSFYAHEDGFVLSAAINKYVYVSVSNPFFKNVFLKYSQIEESNSVNDIKHPIIRETLKILNYQNTGIEISTHADVPAGTGLGSSGSFTTALIKAVMQFQMQSISASELAKMACHIEIDILGEPIGKQDQYIAALGGFQCMTFSKDGEVKTENLKLSTETVSALKESMTFFYTGINRSASEILKDQHTRSLKSESEILGSLRETKSIGYKIKEILEKGDVEEFGKTLNEHWKIKRKRSAEISSEYFDNIYKTALDNGAIGGKLLGAGGGGFFMFISDDKRKLKKILLEKGLQEIDVNFEFEGTKVLLA
jgi:D-glycero-alpha-D-manno-heptose-7-phosphate kinase